MFKLVRVLCNAFCELFLLRKPINYLTTICCSSRSRFCLRCCLRCRCRQSAAASSAVEQPSSSSVYDCVRLFTLGDRRYCLGKQRRRLAKIAQRGGSSYCDSLAILAAVARKSRVRSAAPTRNQRQQSVAPRSQRKLIQHGLNKYNM